MKQSPAEVVSTPEEAKEALKAQYYELEMKRYKNLESRSSDDEYEAKLAAGVSPKEIARAEFIQADELSVENRELFEKERAKGIYISTDEMLEIQNRAYSSFSASRGRNRQ